MTLKGTVKEDILLKLITELEKSNNMKLLNKTPKLNSKNGEISISRKQIKGIAEKIREQKTKQKQHQKSKSIEI